MGKYEVHAIGTVTNNEEGSSIRLDSAYIPALRALDGFGYINVLWWFSDFDNEQARSVLEAGQPYKKAPDKMGIFATRSPVRPNPIALTAVEVIDIDYQNGIIAISYIDANDGTPVLDIKPYTPSIDRVEDPAVPDWCSNWPKSVETSGDFDWADEFNF